MAVIIDGKRISSHIKEKMKTEATDLKKHGKSVGLAVILVGDDPASKVYVRNKKRACEELGIYSEEHTLPKSASQDDLLDLVNTLNYKKNIHGILVQLPLPDHIDENTIINAIHPSKDVDAFHPKNVGKIMIGNYDFLPCTPAGCIELIQSTGVEIKGKECVVVGRSNIVGKPMAMLLLHNHGTVTICHSRTQNLKEVCKRADILVAAVGVPNMITMDMVKPGALVIDVGMNRTQEGKLCGDVDYENVKDAAGYITPVPGGVGPMTIAMLMQNTVTAAKLQQK